MIYREFDPAPGLRVHVSRYWGVTVTPSTAPGHLHRVLPDGCMNLVAMRRGGFTHLTIQGAHATPLVFPVEPGDRYWGVRFWPDAGALVFDLSSEQMVGRMVPGAEVLGASAGELAGRLARASEPDEAAATLDHWLEPRVRVAGPIDTAVRVTVLAIVAGAGGPPVGELARLVGMSPRQLQRRFRKATGLTPKTYARIRRLRTSLAHLLDGPRRSWSEVAAELGYADQAHLVREFTRLAGLTPGEVVTYVAGINHEAVRP